MEENAYTQGDAAEHAEVTSLSEVPTDDGVMKRHQEQQNMTSATQEWVATPRKDDGNEEPKLRGAVDMLQHHPRSTGYQVQTSEAGTQQGSSHAPGHSLIHGSPVSYQDGRKWTCEATQSYGLEKDLEEEGDDKTDSTAVDAPNQAVSTRTENTEPHAITSADELDAEGKSPSKNQKTGTAESPNKPESKATFASHTAITMTHEMDVGSTQVGDEVRPRSDQRDEAEEIVGETDPGGDSAAPLTRTRPKTALKPGEQMMAREADSDNRDGYGEWEGLLLQGEL